MMETHFCKQTNEKMDSNCVCGQISIAHLPEEIVEQILRYLSPYRDFKSAMQVCKTWNRLIKGIVVQKESSFLTALKNCSIQWEEVKPECGSVTERYSHCSVYYDKSVYVFGGCTSTNTTFNDLWKFDLSTRCWIRPLAVGSYPSPKACASMVVYEDSLVLFGGWSHPTQYPLHQAARFFSELHMYKPSINRWFVIETLYPATPKATAGHSASIVGDTMVVFGGSHVPGSGSNEVWQFDFLERVWYKRPTSETKPRPRYGQTQVTLDDTHILIIGGCGGPNQVFSDLWLLSLDQSPWQWEELDVKNQANAAPHLWCHPACKVGNNLVVLSKSTKIFQKADAQPNISTSKNSPSPAARVPDKLAAVPGPSRIAGKQSRVPSVAGPSSIQASNGAQNSPTLPTYGGIGQPSHNAGQPYSSFSDSDDSSGTDNDDPMAEFKHPGQLRSFRSRSNFPQGKPSQNAAAQQGTVSPRPGGPSIRPNSMNNRQKQLEALSKMAERLNKSRTSQSSKTESSLSSVKNVLKDRKAIMHVHVLDLSQALLERSVQWRPLQENFSFSAPEETIFYSMVEGRAELIIFGGIKRDINTMQRGLDLTSHIVSNNLHIISAG